MRGKKVTELYGPVFGGGGSYADWEGGPGSCTTTTLVVPCGAVPGSCEHRGGGGNLRRKADEVGRPKRNGEAGRE